MSLISLTLAQLMKPEPAYLAKASETMRLSIEPLVSALYTPTTVREITEKIGLSETTTRYHIRAMVKTGDVVLHDHKTVMTAYGPKREAVYRMANAR